MKASRILAVTLSLAAASAVRAQVAKPSALADRVLALLADYRADEARDLLRRQNAPDPLLVGLVHHGLYQADSVLAVLGPLHRAARADDRAVLALAEAFLWKKDYRNAQALLDAYPRKEDLGYLRVLATQMELVNRHQEALALWDRIIAADPKPWGAMERKAIVLSWRKRFDESIALFAKVAGSAAASGPLRLRCRVRKAEVVAWNGDLDGSLRVLDSILVEHPRHLDASLQKGQVLEWKGRYPEAKAVYSAILQKRPDHATARLRLEKLGWAR